MQQVAGEDGKVKSAKVTDVFAALFSRPSSNKWVEVPPAGNKQHGHRRHLRLCIAS